MTPMGILQGMMEIQDKTEDIRETLKHRMKPDTVTNFILYIFYFLD